MPPGKIRGVSCWDSKTGISVSPLKPLRNSRRDDSVVQPSAPGWMCWCMCPVCCVQAELESFPVCTTGEGAQWDSQALIDKSFQQIILLFSTQLAVPDASAFLFSHTGECCLRFSLFYHRTLQLDIPLPCIVLCAFFPVPLVPVPVPVPIPCMPLDRMHTQQLCRQCRTEGSGWCSGQLSVAPEGPQETQGVGQQKLPEVQQWDMQSPARDEGGGGRKTLCTRPGWKSAGWAAILERTWGLQWVLHWMLSNLYSHHKKGKSHPGGSGNSLESGSEEFDISSVQCQGGHIWILWAEPI